MEVKEFLANLYTLGFTLIREDDKLVLKGNGKKVSAEAIQAIKQNQEVIQYIKTHKPALLEYLTGSDAYAAKRADNVSSIYRLSSLQEGMLFHSLYDGGGKAYVEQFICQLENVEEGVFRASWQLLLERHSILRTGFFSDTFKIPVQCVYKEVTMPFQVLDFRPLSESEQAQKIAEWEQRDREKSFNFQQAPLMRITLIRLDEMRYRMIWTHHHLILDGWSMQVLMEEFLRVYESLVTGKTPLPVEEDCYEDFIRYTERKDKTQEKAYWQHSLANTETATLLPFIAANADRNKGMGSYQVEAFEVNEALTDQLEAFAQRHRLTINTLVQGVWAYLLYRYTGNPTVTYGVTVSGRPSDLPEVERRIGLYINTVPLQASFPLEESLVTWLQNLQQQQLESREYQYSSLSEIQRWKGIQGDWFDCLLVFENYPLSKVIASQPWQLRVKPVQMHEQTNYPMNVIVGAAETISFRLEYNADLLKKEYVVQISQHFQYVLRQLIEKERGTLQDLDMLSAGERRLLLEDFQGRVVTRDPSQTVLSLFADQVWRTPEAMALVFEQESLSFAQLDQAANRLALLLVEQGVGTETLVPLLLEPGFEQVMAVLAVWKAGGAYVPLDPATPAGRLHFLLQDTGATLLLTTSTTRPSQPLPDAVIVLEIDQLDLLTGSEELDNSQFPPASFPVVKPEQLAYVLYTSGSTGEPKGVMIQHNSLCHYLTNHQTHYLDTATLPVDPSGTASAGGGSYQLLSYGFDASLTSSWLPLLAGQPLVLAPSSGSALFEQPALAQHAPYGFLKLTPAHLPLLALAQAAPFTSRLVVGGEALLSSQLQALADLGQEVEIINEYGPTEATVGVTTYRFQLSQLKSLPSRLPIGKPLDNTQLYLLDSQRQLVPLGVVGEICLAGVSLARGYWNRPELTREKFIPHPFSQEPAARLYRTGDLGRWLPDGTLLYEGRLDEQVKIRGYRIEPGEIEAVLVQSGRVEQAVVVSQATSENNAQLLAYVVAKGEWDPEGVQAYLAEHLPAYLLPSQLVVLPQLPLTTNGKIDKAALPQLQASSSSTGYVAPRNELEEQIAGVWQDVLEIERVGVKDHFFELGGHSLLATRTVSALRKALEVEMIIRDLFTYPILEALAKHLRSKQKGLRLPAIFAQERPDYVSLSFSQERLWFLDQLEGSVHYHLPVVLRLQGRLRVSALTAALKGVVNRHEVLRTVIGQQEGNPYQRVLDKEGWELRVIDAVNHADLQSTVASLIGQPFDLSNEYPLRAHLLSLSAEDNILVLVLHHIASDGWSMPILVRELVEFYQASVANRPVQLPALPIQYADYALWQRHSLSGEGLDGQVAYWQQRLSGVTALDLPTDYPRPAVQRTQGAVAHFMLESALMQPLQRLSHQQGTTSFMTLLTAFKVLLYRYSGGEDICVGSTIANREQPEVEGLIGFFVNTLALRSDLSGNPSFTSLLQRVKQTTLEAYEHQQVPFEKVVEAVVKERNRNRSPLFQVMFDFQYQTALPLENSLPDLTWTTEASEHATAKFDLTFTLAQTPDGLALSVEYATDLYEEATIQRMVGHFRHLLRAIGQQPTQTIGELRIMTPEEEKALPGARDGSFVSFPKEKTMVDLLEAQVVKTPDAVAVSFEGEQLTYQQLHERTNQLAHYLRELGVREETLVPICLERSLDMVVGILGILKAGGAYVPIDPAYPRERIHFMLEDTQASVVVSDSAQHSSWSTTGSYTLVELDTQGPLLSEYPTRTLETALLPDHLAYVIYTSGSTGRPKGVLIEHRNVVRLFETDAPLFDFNSRDVWTMFHSFCFDFSVWEMYGALFYGGRLVVVPKHIARDTALFAQLLLTEGVTVLNQTPAAFYALQEWVVPSGYPLATRYVIFGGEALNPVQLQPWKKAYPACRLVNMYGITETTVHVTYQLLEESHLQGSSSVIGTPIPTLQAYVLDAHQHVCPIGIPGELYIGGAGLARGYFNRSELTAQRFIPHPFRAGERLYRTGDLGRWRSDGSLEYLGRIDEQVKIRGYRIEPGEIESLLLQSNQVRQAVVLASPLPDGTKQLVAYIVPEDILDPEALGAYVRAHLPDYMVPMQWESLAALPLTSNGKVDKKSLPEPGQLHRQVYAAPRNAFEQQLVRVWQQQLQVETIGIYDNFFELGGHSLLVTRTVSALRKALPVLVEIRDLFAHPTIAALASYLQTQPPSYQFDTLSLQQRPDYIPLSFSQERLWFLDQLEGSVAYHIPVVLRLEGTLNTQALASALQAVINRHEVLRTVLNQHDGKPYQRVLNKDTWRMQTLKRASVGEEPLPKLVETLLRQPFDLSEEHPLRAHLLELDTNKYLIVITVHHIAADGWSMSLLVDELTVFYRTYAEDGAVALPALPIQYADYALWQRQQLSGDRLAEQLAYWQQQLLGVEALQLPTDFVRPASSSTRGAALAFSLDPSMSASLQALSRQEGSTLFMTLLAAFQVLLQRYSGQTDICVGSAIANREQPEVEGLIGFFANALALRSDLSGNPSFLGLLERVKATTLEAYEHQQVPFEKVVDAVVQERDRTRSPLFQVMFDLVNAAEVKETQFSGLTWTAEEIEHQTTKFDLTFTVVETAEGLVGSVEYATDLFLPATIERMVEHFRHLLQAILTNPHQPISQLDCLPAGERRLLLEDFQGKVVASDPTQTVLSLFADQVRRTPDSLAVRFEGQPLSFAQLNEAANRLARLLVQQGVGTETLVPLLLEPGFEQVLAVLAVWKAGGAYVPLDPATPAGRLQFLLQDTEASLLLTTSPSRPSQPLPDAVTILELDRMDLIHRQGFVDAESVLSLPVVKPQQLAYVLYTSGSTGEPKGVMIQHNSLAHYLTNAQTQYLTPVGESGRIESDPATLRGDQSALATPGNDEPGRERIGGGSYQLLSYGFDASLTSSWLPLLAGQPLVLAPSSGSALFEAPALAQNAPYGFLKLTPAHLPLLALAQAAPFTSRLVVGGEALLCSQLQALADLGQEVEIINEYGPTEATVGVTTYRFQLSQLAQQESRIPIGKPLDNTQLYLLDSQRQLVPLGVVGEICLAGVSLARGYWNRPELTREKFIPHPFSQEPAARLYRTGDLGRWLPDGTLLYEGRLDEQVKLRGYRIEPGEIEAVLVQSGRVEQAVVLAQASGENSTQLLAYVVARGEWDQAAVQAYLAEHLPAYLLPSQLVVLSALPLTTNGKIDKAALPQPQTTPASGYVAPRNELEQTIARIWQDLLGVEPVGMHDNFFALGGDSIITIQVVSRARRAGVELQVGDLFEHQTIEKLSAVLAGRAQSQQLVGEQGRLSGESGLLPIQQWFWQKGAPQPQHFNQSVLLGIDKAIPTAQLQQVVAVLVAQHDALRFAYQPTESGWQQSYGEANISLIVEQLGEHPQQSLAQQVEERANAYQRSLSPEKGELCRIVLLQTPDPETHHRLLFIVHHLAVDGVSWRILLEELSQLLEQVRSHQPLSLGAKSSSYRQWQAALAAYGQSERALSQLPYWQAVVKAAQPLPVDESYSSGLTLADTARYSGKLPAELTQALLQGVPAVYHTEVNDLLLAALAQTLGEWSGQSPVVIGLEGHGREPDLAEGVDLSRTLGWFTSLYPVRLPVASQPGELIASVKETLRQVPDKGMAYGVLTELNKEKSLQGAAPWEVVFNYLGQFDQVLSSGKGELIGASESPGQNTAASYPVAEKLSITSLVQGGELLVEWVYSGRHYQPETVQRLTGAYLANLQNLIEHCQQLTQPVFTPADYGLSREVSFSELDAFLNENVGEVPRSQFIDGLYRLSGMQEGMLFHSLYDQAALAYLEQFSYDLPELDVDAFRQSWQHVLAGHSILRSAFFADAFRIPVQAVYREVAMPVEVLDFRSLNPADQTQRLDDFEATDREKGFDLQQAPLMRITLIRLDEARYRMIWTHHHLILDGWSMPVLMEEFLRTYETLVEQQPLAPRQEDRYEDYIRYLERQDKNLEKHHWQRYLAGLETGTLLPFIPASSERNKGVGEYREEVLQLDQEVTARLEGYAQQHHLTVNTVMQGVWAYLLYRYTGNDRVTFGVVVSGRPDDLPEVESRIGMYINTLPLGATVSAGVTVRDWLQTLQVEQLQSRQYQYSSLREVQQWVGISGDLFDTVFVYENYPVSEGMAAQPWKLQVETVHMHEQTNYPLTVVVAAAQQMTVRFGYNAQLLAEREVKRIGEHFQRILLQMLDQPGAFIRDIDPLTPSEKQLLLETYNQTTVAYPVDVSLVTLFEAQVAAHPEATALLTGAQAWTYRELNEGANQLAHALVQKGVTAHSLVPLCTERSLAMIVGILGILKAGGAYVALDPEYPADRMAYILEEVGTSLLVTDQANADRFAGRELLCLDRLESTGLFSKENPSLLREGNTRACVLYTSGSTGKPKGVILTHAAILNRLYWMWETYPFTPGEKSALKTSIGFVDHLWELFGPLNQGIPSVLFAKEEVVDMDGFVRSLDQHQITRLVLVPSLLVAILHKLEAEGLSLEKLTYWTCSGEALTADVVESFYLLFPAQSHTLLNIYGSTEVTADATCYDTARPLRSKLAKEGDGDWLELTVRDEIEALLKDFQNRSSITQPLTPGNLPAHYYESSSHQTWQPAEYLEFLRNDLLPHVVNVAKPGFVGHMTSVIPPFVRELNALMVALNQNLVKIETSLVATSLERQVLGMFHKQVYKFKEAFYQQHIQNPESCLGILTNGGTISNITALSYALRKALAPDASFEGLAQAGLLAAMAHYRYERVAVIGSGLVHYSVGKALQILGLGKASYVQFDFDKTDAEASRQALIQLIESLQQQRVLVLAIIGVAGSTETGRVDPLLPLGQIARQFGIHYHVDGAFGGAYVFSSRLAKKLKGIDYADSITMCGHKQMLLPMGASLCLFRSPDFASYSENNTYYQARKGSLDLGRYTLEGSRPFVSLLFHSILKILGADQFGQLLELNYEKTQLFADKIRAHESFELIEEPDLNILIYRFVPAGLRTRLAEGELGSDEMEWLNEINRRLQKIQFLRGGYFVSYSEIAHPGTTGSKERIVVLRAVLMNPATTVSILDALLTEQVAIGHEIASGKDATTANPSSRSLPPAIAQSTRQVPIGKPLANTRIYLLHPDGQLCAPGVPGEICVAGAAVAQGYLNLPEVTQEKFMDSPFVPGERLYKMGDRGRWLPDGNLEYLGRRDDQVKIRGYRIELGEIESVLMQSEAVKQAVVLTKPDATGNLRLVAYVLAKETFRPEELLAFLRNQLPDYMVPTRWVPMESFPLTASGKIDRKALPDPEVGESERAMLVPRNWVEQQIAQVWQTLLQVPHVGVDDHFFELGGHSLLATRAASALRKVLHAEISIKDIFVYPTLGALAAFVQGQQPGQRLPVLTTQPRPPYVALSFNQERLWVIDQLEGSVAYHLPAVLRIEGPLQVSALTASLRAIVRRHEILRTVIERFQDRPYQRVLPADTWQLHVIEADPTPARELSARIETLIDEPFDLSKDYPLRATLVQHGKEAYVLVVVLHHIAADGWSLPILVHELSVGYRAAIRNQPADLPALAVQYADFALWQRTYLQGDVLTRQLAYWQQQLAGVQPLDLPTDSPRPVLPSTRGALVEFSLDAELSQHLNEFSRQQGTTLFMTLLAAYKVLLYRYSGQEDICVGSPIAGRQHQELEGLIGFFVNTVALRSRVEGEVSFQQLLQTLKQTTLAAYEHQQVPLEKIVQAVARERDTSRSPFFQVLFELQNNAKVAEATNVLEGVTVLPADVPHRTSKFEIAFMLTEREIGMVGSVEYRTDLYEERTIRQLVDNYQHLLRSVVANAEQKISELSMGTPLEQWLVDNSTADNADDLFNF